MPTAELTRQLETDVARLLLKVREDRAVIGDEDLAKAAIAAGVAILSSRGTTRAEIEAVCADAVARYTPPSPAPLAARHDT